MHGPAWTTLAAAGPGQPILVCFHCAGGSAQSFLPWRAPADGRYGLVAAELPGRGARYREPFQTSIGEAAASFAASFAGAAGLLPHGPRIFLGHSLGALVAYETAHALRERGAPAPAGLIAIGRSAPDAAGPGQGLPDASLPAVRAYLDGLGGTPGTVLGDEAFMAMMMPILAADFDLLRTYRHRVRPPLAMPVHVVGGLDDPAVRFEALLGWSPLFSGRHSLSLVDGGHFAPLKRPEIVFSRADRIIAAASAPRAALPIAQPRGHTP